MMTDNIIDHKREYLIKKTVNTESKDHIIRHQSNSVILQTRKSTNNNKVSNMPIHLEKEQSGESVPEICQVPQQHQQQEQKLKREDSTEELLLHLEYMHSTLHNLQNAVGSVIETKKMDISTLAKVTAELHVEILKRTEIQYKI